VKTEVDSGKVHSWSDRTSVRLDDDVLNLST